MIKEEIRKGKIEYQSGEVVNSIVSELKEMQEDCKDEGTIFNPSDYMSSIYRSTVFHDGNFSFIIGLMFTDEDNEKVKLTGVMAKGNIEERYQQAIFPKLWEKALAKI